MQAMPNMTSRLPDTKEALHTFPHGIQVWGLEYQKLVLLQYKCNNI
jgi:hypothetical protein